MAVWSTVVHSHGGTFLEVRDHGDTYSLVITDAEGQIGGIIVEDRDVEQLLERLKHGFVGTEAAA